MVRGGMMGSEVETPAGYTGSESPLKRWILF